MAEKRLYGLQNVKVGDRVRMFNQKRGFNVMARSDRYIILSKKCFGKALYTIVDLEFEEMGPDNLIFGIYDYCDPKDCKEALKDLEEGEIEISRRHQLSFDEYCFRYGEVNENQKNQNHMQQ